jgi:hypothetical protein
MQGLDVAAKSTSDDTLISKVRLWLLLFTPFARLPAERREGPFRETPFRETPFRETPFRETMLVGALAGTWQFLRSGERQARALPWPTPLTEFSDHAHCFPSAR